MKQMTFEEKFKARQELGIPFVLYYPDKRENYLVCPEHLRWTDLEKIMIAAFSCERK